MYEDVILLLVIFNCVIGVMNAFNINTIKEQSKINGFLIAYYFPRIDESTKNIESVTKIPPPYVVENID
jgi:hypothetical protein